MIYNRKNLRGGTEMQRSMKTGEVITLSSDGKEIGFTVKEVKGVGGSCIAYGVSYTENGDIPHYGILKEFCPAYLENYDFERNESGIKIPDELSGRFQSDCEQFRQTYLNINRYLADNLSAANYHTVQIGLFEGCGTWYTLTAADFGTSYDRVEDTGLSSLLKIILSVTKAVEMYHNAGYLHLDIKPENVLILDGVTELVKLFDFDSLTAISDIKSRRIDAVPVPEDYYVPELSNGEIRRIGIPTDIYEIGAMLFLRLFGRAPLSKDISHSAKYDFDSSPLMRAASPAVRFEVGKLLNNTLQISAAKRYKTTAGLKAQIEKIIEIITADTAYPLNLPAWQPSALSVGREDEIRALKERLDSDGYVFVKGMGGVGKSELTKLFVQKYRNEYHTVQFCRFNGSLKALTAAMPFYGINDSDYADFDSLVNVKNKNLHMCDSNTLIIVDNFNVTYDSFLRDFLPADNKSFKVIFTTRCAQASDYLSGKTMELSCLPEEECTRLFFLHSLLTPDIGTIPTVKEIISAVERNTLIIILLAAVIKKGGISIDDVIKRIADAELNVIEDRVFHEYDINAAESAAYGRIAAHLDLIFDMSGLKEKESEALKNMTLISHDGIESDSFIQLCEEGGLSESVLDSLVNQSWANEENGMISLHPIVSDVIWGNEKIEKSDSYYRLFNNLLSFYQNDKDPHISHKTRILSAFIQLERRSRNENSELRIGSNMYLGLAYKNMYQAQKARDAADKCLKISDETGNRDFVMSAYLLKGEIEKTFGTAQDAISLYEKALSCSKNIKFRDYETALITMVATARCCDDMKNGSEALNYYKKALKYAKFHRLHGYIYSIAREAAEICADLNLKKEKSRYLALQEKYKAFADTDEIPPELKNVKLYQSTGDIKELSRASSDYFSRIRDEMGEESPDYKYMSLDQWTLFALENDKETAMRKMTESLGFIEETFGKDSLEMARQLEQVAVTLPTLGELNFASESAERGLEICRKLNQTDSFLYLELQTALALCRLLSGRADESARILDTVDFSRFEGRDAADNLISTAGFALLETDAAWRIEPVALKLLEYDDVSPLSRYLSCLLLANLYNTRGEIKKAEKYLTEAEKTADKIAESNSKKALYASFCRIKAISLFKSGLKNEALETVNEADRLFSGNDRYSLQRTPTLLNRAFIQASCFNPDAAEADCRTCEEIYRKNNMPEESYIRLYNQIAVIYINKNDFAGAKEILDKAISIYPELLNASTLQDITANYNYGWCTLNMGNPEEAVNIIKKSIDGLKRAKMKKSTEYFAINKALSYAYMLLGDYKKTSKILAELSSLYSEITDDNEYSIRRDLIIRIIYLQLVLQPETVYDFALMQLEQLKDDIGENSIPYIDTLIDIGAVFRNEGHENDYKFILAAEELLNKNGLQKTLTYAVMLNHRANGVYDLGEYKVALMLYKKSKALFEELGMDNHPVYSIVTQNIKDISDLINEEDSNGNI